MNESIYENMRDLSEHNWWFLVQGKIIQYFLGNCLKGNRNLNILDAGSGTGRLYGVLSRYGNVFGVEPHRGASQLCKEKGYKKVINDSLEKIGFPDNSFDVIVCVDVLEHVEKDQNALKECYRVLKKGGYFLITVPAGQLFFSKNELQYGHFRRYDNIPFREKILQAGFKISMITHFNFLLLPPIVLIRMVINILISVRIVKKPMGELASPEIFNRMFKFIFGLELKLLKRVRIPFGLSLLAVARKS